MELSLTLIHLTLVTVILPIVIVMILFARGTPQLARPGCPTRGGGARFADVEAGSKQDMPGRHGSGGVHGHSFTPQMLHLSRKSLLER